MDYDWKRERRSGIAAIAFSSVVAAGIWFGVVLYGPSIERMETVADRTIFALKCCCIAVLFSFAMGVEAVAHERLQSAAFDPLAGRETRRLRVNQRYLQNTLEQLVIFIVGLFGLAFYSAGAEAMRAVLATTIVWMLARFAFWLGYHRSAAMRGLGAPGMMVGLLVLIYVAARIGDDAAGVPGALAVILTFLLIEAVLFWKTREPG